MDKLFKVMLDTNVLMNGAFFPRGPSTKLLEIKNQVRFFVGERSLKEAEILIKKNSPSPESAETFLRLLNDWILQLHSHVVRNPEDNGTSIPGLDEADRHVFLAAQAASCDFICTYDRNDFPKDMIPLITPLGLLRRLGQHTLDNMIQYPLLGEEGTLFFMGDLHHPSSMGLLFKTSAGLSVRGDENGQIVIEGLGESGNQKVVGILPGENSPFALICRYKKTGDFEALSWPLTVLTDSDKVYALGQKQPLSYGKARFEPPISPGLFFQREHNFFGHVQNLSGMPRYLREKDIEFVVQNFGLEAVWGSIGISYALKTGVALKTQI